MNLLNFIVGKGDNKEDILMNIYVDNKRNIDSINFAGLIFTNEDIKKFTLPKIDSNLLSAMSDNKPMDITSQYADKTPEQILEMFQLKFTQSSGV